MLSFGLIMITTNEATAASPCAGLTGCSAYECVYRNAAQCNSDVCSEKACKQYTRTLASEDGYLGRKKLTAIKGCVLRKLLVKNGYPCGEEK